MKYEIQRTSLFKKDYKRVQKRGCNIELLKDVIAKLANGEELPLKNKDHALSGDWEGYRECLGVRFECAASVPHFGRPPYGILPLLRIGCWSTG